MFTRPGNRFFHFTTSEGPAFQGHKVLDGVATLVAEALRKLTDRPTGWSILDKLVYLPGLTIWLYDINIYHMIYDIMVILL